MNSSPTSVAQHLAEVRRYEARMRRNEYCRQWQAWKYNNDFEFRRKKRLASRRRYYRTRYGMDPPEVSAHEDQQLLN